jgi:hypothetical protein
LLSTQTFDPADSPRELHHTQLPEKQQISIKIYSEDEKSSKIISGGQSNLLLKPKHTKMSIK